MKKNNVILLIVFSLAILVLGFSYNKDTKGPSTVYEVYLDEEKIGTIISKERLEKFIDAEGSYIKNKYNVDMIYAPEGLEIIKKITFDEKIDKVEDVYAKIKEKKSFTIEGYQFSIKEEENNTNIYVLDENVFNEAVTSVIETFIGKNDYDAYTNDKQNPIETVGTLIENIYVEENITVKKKQISVDEKIYTDKEDLTRFLLYGEEMKQTNYTVLAGETIASIAFKNEISVEEFLMSNPKFTNENNLVYAGQEVVIAYTNPKIRIVAEKHTVEDVATQFTIEERYDEDRLIGDDEIIQYGENGLERVTRKVKYVNGGITYVNSVGTEVIKPAITQIIVKGEKYIPNVGSLSSWGWPTDSGYKITDYYAWRTNPVTYRRELHSGIDIAGVGYGANIYATNNGTIVKVAYSNDYGYHVVINHNNGYYTLYAHMSKFAETSKVGNTVARGQIIGYIGTSGWVTGPHVHYEIWKGCEYCRLNPLSMYQ